ncbi:serine hydrolase domain-containing protein [Stenotrophomonas sp. GZD-301]|uniref:serine hydrolase domain-containing protein n=1 Tax=Stenotrophomonas sp. GZD-301 TaxID=3404814 RepID=UPI003BB5FD69
MPSRRHRFLLIFATLILPGLPPLHAAPTTTAWEQANAQTRRFVQETMQAQRIPGLQIAVVMQGRVVLSEALGVANVENGTATTPTTRFPLNSATKSFTGVAMAQLADAGRVDLDAPLARYLDDLPAAWRGVRVRQLLAHTSGLPDILDAHGLIGGGTEQDAWTAVTALPVEAPPGERFMYNQTNYVLLARIIARQSGMPYAQYLQQQFTAAGMPRTTFGDSYDLVAGAATMYSYFPRSTDAPDATPRLSHWFYDMPPTLWAGGGILTTADDVAQWMVAVLQHRLLGRGGTARMWRAERLNDGTDGRWAAGWPVLNTAPDLQVGGMGGARAAFIVYPERGLAVIVLTNLVGANPQTFIPAIADFYAPPPAVSRAARPSPAGSRR